MGQFKESNREQINLAAGNYLSDQETGDNYDAYLELLRQSDMGNDDCLASDYVEVWQPLEHFTVAKMIETIENSVVKDIQLPELYKGISWEDLKGQKSVLLTLIGVIEDTKPQPVKFEGSDMVAILVPKEMNDALYGILHLIDSIQDDAVDNFDMDEKTVFELHDEDEDKEDVIPETDAPVNDKPKEKFKVWVEVERIGLDADGNEESYTDEECPIGIAYRDNIEDAVSLQNLIQNSFGEI